LSGIEPPEVKELVEQAWIVVEPFLKISPEESEYTAAIQRGELQLHILFKDDPEAGRILGEHPAIQWKLLNVRKHLIRLREKQKR
jgi:hypothetical protein